MSEIINWIKNHKAISIAIAVVGGLLIYAFIKSKQQVSAGNTSGTPGQTGPGEQYYIALLQSEDESTRPIHIPPTGGASPPQPSPSPGPKREPPSSNPPPPDNSPICTPGFVGTCHALIPKGAWPQSVKWANGNQLQWGGNWYTIVVGSQGRIWGIPGRYSAADAVKRQDGILLYQG